ncbi:MAG: fatty acyl-AMP ligase [Phormidesmis sp.]|mgnify:CR=1 FL=1
MGTQHYIFGEMSGEMREVVSLVDLLRLRSQFHTDQIGYTFLRNGETLQATMTYGELDKQARKIGGWLQANIPQGTRVLLLYQPGLSYISAFFGCLYANVVAVPAYPPRRNQNLSRLQSIIKDADIGLALTSTDIKARLTAADNSSQEMLGLPLLDVESLDENLSLQWQPLKSQSSSTAFIQYTSGSTGNPKGVMVSHGNLLHNLGAIYSCFNHSPNSRGVIWLPPYHDMGLIGGVLQPLYGGFPVTLMSSVDFLQKPVRWLKAISHTRATTSGGPNFAYDLIVRRAKPEKLEGLDLSCWDLAFTGAEPIRAETLTKFAEMLAPYGFRADSFYPCYGMAESTLIISGGAQSATPNILRLDANALERNLVQPTPISSTAHSVVGCGKSIAGQAIVIANPDTSRLCTEGEIGEIWVTGESVAQGYWNNPKETQRAFQATLLDADGKPVSNKPFMRTGDLGFLQKDELFITGRLKDLIIIRGQNHYPQDIELTVEESHPALRTNSGVAFSIDVKSTEKLVIVYELKRSYLRKPISEEVFKRIREAVASRHALQTYAIALVKTGTVPKTSSGKVRRSTTKADFLNGNLTIVSDWSQNPAHRTDFKNLQSELGSMMSRLQASKK